MSDFKTTDGLMRHLRENGISIKGSSQKRNLIHIGYYHGYKGYRFFQNASRPIPYTNFNELFAVVQYDTQLKALFYPQLMFLETALKNIVLNNILLGAQSQKLSVIYDRVIQSYNHAPPNTDPKTRTRFQTLKLRLQNKIQKEILTAYSHNNQKIVHFYNNPNYSEVPVWAVFEILMLGDFGTLVSCLDIQIREEISKDLEINLSADTNREVIYKLIYIIKDLRNAVAHNEVAFDARFRRTEISKPVKICLENDLAFPYINFKSIVDYIALIVYLLVHLKVAKRTIQSFMLQFEKTLSDLSKSISPAIYRQIIHADTPKKIQLLKIYIKTAC